MLRAWRRREIHKEFWLGNLREESTWGVDGKITLEWMLGKQRGKLWSGFVWLRIRISGGLL
jgi:hypothetical protein